MKQVSLTIPEIGLIAGTRAAGAAGLALLLSDRVNPEQRRAIGWTLLAVGLITTVPLVAQVFGKRQPCETHSATGGEVANRETVN